MWVDSIHAWLVWFLLRVPRHSVSGRRRMVDKKALILTEPGHLHKLQVATRGSGYDTLGDMNFAS